MLLFKPNKREVNTVDELFVVPSCATNQGSTCHVNLS